MTERQKDRERQSDIEAERNKEEGSRGAETQRDIETQIDIVANEQRHRKRRVQIQRDTDGETARVGV